MDIDEELRQFLLKIPRKVGQLKLDGTARKMRELDPVVQARNYTLILDYFGFGEEHRIKPTYDELGQKYGGLTRERIRQLIQRNYHDHIDDPLSVATEVGKVIGQKDFWEERDLLEQLQDRHFARDFPNAIGVIDYLQSQGLVKDYDVYLPTLEKVTRAKYGEREQRMVVSIAKLKMLKKDLRAAYTTPGQVGLGNVRHVKRGKETVETEILKTLIRSNPNAWSAIEGGQFWYIFEDHKDNCLINAAEKVFSIVENLPLEKLVEMLSHSLRRRAAKTEFPSDSLIQTWIIQSHFFTVENEVVTFKGTPTSINGDEETLYDVMFGKGNMQTPEVTNALVEKGVSLPSAQKLVFNSPLVFVDRTNGRGSYVVTLATDLDVGVKATDESRYDFFKKRLAAVGKTDRVSAGTARREQSILADWIFGDKQYRRCAICQQKYSRKALIVAHKKKRSKCTDSERLDPYIVFPLCSFGCDFLYEYGFVRIRNGRVEQGNKPLSKTERNAVGALAGTKLKSQWLKGDEYFDNDRVQTL